MKFKTFAIILALFGFSASLFAQPVSYSFSSFGGGLPSSAKKVSFSANADTVTSQRIIVEDSDEVDTDTDSDSDYDSENYYDYSDEPTVNKNKKTAIIITSVVVGIVVVAGIAFGTYYLASESGKCCETTTDNLVEGCGQGCGEACGQSMGEACSSSSSQACSSSSTSSTTSCDTSSLGSIFASGLSILPIYVP